MSRIKQIIATIAVCFVMSITASAQAHYGGITHDTDISINLETENDSVFLYLTYHHTLSSYRLPNNPRLLLRTMKDEVISLDGVLIRENKKDVATYVAGNALIPNEYISYDAKFLISKEDVLKFASGIKKLRLNSTPQVHEKSWKKDKIGKVLYEKYIEGGSDTFSEGF